MPSYVRPATAADLDSLAGIEAAADALFTPLFGETGWDQAPAGTERAAEGGFLLVVSPTLDGPVVGFAHVLEVDLPAAHLEQLSVDPDHARAGHGRALLDASAEEAHRRGATSLTLRTYADVPFNAPFYASAGFAEDQIPDTDFQRRLTAAEDAAGLAEHGRRVHMVRVLGLDMSAEQFEQLVTDELDALPDDMVEGLENVVFVVEDAPEDGAELFGLYEGVALTERGQYGLGELPDRIIVYRAAHLAACRDDSELRDEVHTTLVHEIAHFYGIDDEQLHDLGWA